MAAGVLILEEFGEHNKQRISVWNPRGIRAAGGQLSRADSSSAQLSWSGKLEDGPPGHDPSARSRYVNVQKESRSRLR